MCTMRSPEVNCYSNIRYTCYIKYERGYKANRELKANPTGPARRPSGRRPGLFKVAIDLGLTICGIHCKIRLLSPAPLSSQISSLHGRKQVFAFRGPFFMFVDQARCWSYFNFIQLRDIFYFLRKNFGRCVIFTEANFLLCFA